MNKKRYVFILDAVARDHVPADVDLLPRIAAQLQTKDNLTMKPHRSLAWTLILVLIGLAVVSTAAYALYNYFGDPGLQSVRDAGLGTHPDVTAQPTLVPKLTATPVPTQAPPDDENTQTRGGVTVHLDRVELTELGQVVQFRAKGLKAGQSFSLPEVEYGSQQTEQYRGSTLVLTEKDGETLGTFSSYQLLRASGDSPQVDLSIRLPLMNNVDWQAETLAVFEFAPKAVAIGRYQLPQQQTYSVRYDGLTLRLESLHVTADRTLALLCAPVSEAGSDWTIEQASIAWLNRKGQPVGSETVFFAFRAMETTSDSRCGVLSFAAGSREGGPVVLLTIRELAGSAPKSGKWDFYADLPSVGQPEEVLVSQAPLSAETIGSLTAHLRWAFADSKRIAVEVEITGWQPEYMLQGAVLKDKDGNPVGSGWGNPEASEDSMRVVFTLGPDNPGFLIDSRVAGSVEVPVYTQSEWETPLASFHFDFDLPVYPAKSMEIGQSVTANGIELRLETVEMTASYTTLKLCYQKPAHEGNSDWMLSYETLLQVGSYESKLESYRLLLDSDYDLNKGGDLLPPGGTGRCVEIGMPLGHFNQGNPATFTLTIPHLELSQPEVIPDAEVQAANEKLKAVGIEMSFTSYTSTSGGGGGLVIIQKPEGMEDQEVHRRFFNALGYYYLGPWSFTFTVQPE